MVDTPVIPAMHMGSVNRRTVVQAGQGINVRPISKITKVKRAGNMAEVIEQLPSKHEAPYSQNKKKKKVYDRVLGQIR
jgi:hypothetical protein